MLKLIAFLSAFFVVSQAYAYKAGTYICRSSANSRAHSVYILQDLILGPTNKQVTAPYLAVEKYIPSDIDDPNSPIRKYEAKGFATYYSDDSGTETLMVGNF